ncbi:DUF1857-domain-containing protein [Durotheca rogersii]|uniref:DUF1857-domain-containing protein n=1 Tax=Durotheca rogersii TaxID=419775 RepID=UPI00221E86AB|nr:DUF1857-domain-containing protein [Durotheca rogersii]KAI5864868.1 DUF1857-domain-containing protein [Durotheca rogersii]
MVTLNLAYTAPINPPGALPVLTGAQVWAGLERKVHRAHEFVPAIGSCTVLSSSADNVVLREIRFVAGARPGSGSPDPDPAAAAAGAPPALDPVPVRERCHLFPPCRVDFAQLADGATISNIVSRSSAGDLLMTYVFEWRRPAIADGSEAARALEEQSTKAVATTATLCFCGSGSRTRYH